MSVSRYRDCAVLSLSDGSGRLVHYRAPRILPQGSSVSSGTSTPVQATEVHRLDLIAYRTLRDPEQAWRVADANDAIDPFDLCRRTDAVLRIPASGL